MTAWQVVTLAIAILAYGVGIGCAIHALMTKTRSPTSAMAWILICLSLPLVGGVFYLTIGQDRVARRREFELRAARAAWRHLRPARSAGEVRMSHQDEEGPLHMEEVIAKITRAPVVAGNALDLYVGGERAYPAMLESIAEARDTVHAQFYIFDDDRIGKEFRAALIRKAKEGVQVRVLFDSVGCAANWRGFWEGFRDGGVKAAPFMPIRPLKRRWQVNLRNHRKILVVDGKAGFTGSMNIGGRHVVSQGGHSYDLMARVRGPAAQALQEVFARDWYYAVGEDLSETTAFREVAEAGDLPLQVLESGPDQGHGLFHLTLLAAIHQARTSLTLVTPYFVPDVSILDGLVLAARRGVSVEIIVPEAPNSVLVRLASRDFLRKVLLAGGVVRQKPPPMMHVKLFAADNDLVLLGSSNCDNRSFFLNFELDLAIHGRRFASVIEELLERERKESRVLSVLEALEDTNVSRLASRLAALCAPVL